MGKTLPKLTWKEKDLKVEELPAGYINFNGNADIAKKEKLTLKLNNRAMMTFMFLAFTDAVYMNYSQISKDQESFPYGLSYLVVTEKLMKGYWLADKITEVHAKTDLWRVKMKCDNTPDSFINKVLSLKSRYHNVKGALAESELVTKAMAKAPATSEYKALITTLMITNGDDLNLEHICQRRQPRCSWYHQFIT